MMRPRVRLFFLFIFFAATYVAPAPFASYARANSMCEEAAPVSFADNQLRARLFAKLTASQLSNLKLHQVDRTILSLHGNQNIIQRVQNPSPTDKVVIDGKEIKTNFNKGEADSCIAAVQDFQAFPEPSVQTLDASYACALLKLDRKCLTNAEVQPHVDPAISERSVVVLTLDQFGAYCSGLITDKNHIVTARHCFIDPKSGKPLSDFADGTYKSIHIESIDGKRKASLPIDAIGPLSLNAPFDIDKDAVVIPVSLSVAPDALPLPAVDRTPDTLLKKDTPLWIAGPVFLLDHAIALERNFDSPGATYLSDWHDAIRWSKWMGAQCRLSLAKSPCGFHSCQTFKGFSGSPLIISATDKSGSAVIQYAGLHSGAPSDKVGAAWSTCLADSPGFDPWNYNRFNVGVISDF